MYSGFIALALYRYNIKYSGLVKYFYYKIITFFCGIAGLRDCGIAGAEKAPNIRGFCFHVFGACYSASASASASASGFGAFSKSATLIPPFLRLSSAESLHLIAPSAE